jgi:hypothetical protein
MPLPEADQACRMAASHLLECRTGRKKQALPATGGGMMWALYCNDQQISRAFNTEKEAWHHARKSSLVDGGRLPEGFAIREVRRQTEAA